MPKAHQLTTAWPTPTTGNPSKLLWITPPPTHFFFIFLLKFVFVWLFFVVVVIFVWLVFLRFWLVLVWFLFFLQHSRNPSQLQNFFRSYWWTLGSQFTAMKQSKDPDTERMSRMDFCNCLLNMHLFYISISKLHFPPSPHFIIELTILVDNMSKGKSRKWVPCCLFQYNFLTCSYQ